MSGTTTYYDTRWSGTLANITGALQGYGFTVNADGSVALTTPAQNTLGIIGLAGGFIVTLDGISYAAPRSTSPLPSAANLTDPGAQHMAAFVGVWSPDPVTVTLITLDEFQARFLPAETAAMSAAIAANPALGVPLAAASAAGSVNLSDPNLVTWLNSFPAGTFAPARVVALTAPVQE